MSAIKIPTASPKLESDKGGAPLEDRTISGRDSVSDFLETARELNLASEDNLIARGEDFKRTTGIRAVNLSNNTNKTFQTVMDSAVQTLGPRQQTGSVGIGKFSDLDGIVIDQPIRLNKNGPVYVPNTPEPMVIKIKGEGWYKEVKIEMGADNIPVVTRKDGSAVGKTSIVPLREFGVRNPMDSSTA